MRTEHYRSRDLVELFRRQTIATLAEVKAALGTRGDATAFRKLAEVSSRTSYSHRGGYYTLPDIPEYNEHGLWSFASARFSRYGTLLKTSTALVERAAAGFYANELDEILGVEVKGALLKLFRERRLSREELAGRYLYCSGKPEVQRDQVRAREVAGAAPLPTGRLPHPETMPDKLKATIILFLGLLDERQRRVFAGLESLKLGRGGDSIVAETLGLDTATVAKGRRELLGNERGLEGVRKAGGGRKAVEKKRPKSSRASRSS